MSSRKPTVQELKLIDFLVQKAGVILDKDWKERLLVLPMEDGGMGSLLLAPSGQFDPERRFGRQGSEHRFQDIDGITVLASLNLDKAGGLFELDVWKSNFAPLKELPKDI